MDIMSLIIDKGQSAINEKAEQLRNKFFENPVGCYSCFDMIPEFKEINLPKELEILFDPEPKNSKINYFSNGSDIVAWDWSSGDGTLFIQSNDDKYISYDCKKDYKWKEL